MEINKSQGQSLSVFGLHLGDPWFPHGQLYVGYFRTGSKINIYNYGSTEKTKNIV